MAHLFLKTQMENIQPEHLQNQRILNQKKAQLSGFGEIAQTLKKT